MKKKISQKDISAWENFIRSEKFVEDKDELIKKRGFFKKKIKKIDLHGYSLTEANDKIERFINQSHIQGVEKIIVITGKGLRSKNYENPHLSKDLGTLKYSVPEFIKTNENIKKKVKKISDAKIEDGGEGAFYIFLETL